MDFSVGISEFNTNYTNLNAIDEYNKFLQGNASFEVDKTAFDEELEKASGCRSGAGHGAEHGRLRRARNRRRPHA